MLEVKEISYQKNYRQLFNKLSFSVDCKQILRISGNNGSGKTSLLKIIAGLSTADYGEVFLNKKQVKSPKYQAQIFYLGHMPALSFELTALENLTFLMGLNNKTSKQTLKKALQHLGLGGFENEYCAQLSTGQRKRLVIAGLFVSNALVWLLDEPFSTLDTAIIPTIEEQIQKHCDNGGICIFTTHQDSAINSQKVLTL